MTNVDLNAERLTERLEILGRLGATAEGGVTRLALDAADKAARDQVVAWMQELQLDITVDGIGNICGTRKGREAVAPVMTGSHIDSVVNGGRLDGPYGVLAGLEVIESLNEAGVETLRPIAVTAFTNEEGVRFQPDMMGSLVYAGGLALADALCAVDRDGARLGEALQATGYAGSSVIGAVRPHAFVELHIEQGPVLETEGLQIGAVENLQGISWREIDIAGQANHAGTTPMRLRHDAGYCAAEITRFVRNLTTEIDGQMGTIGVMELRPNAINVVPSQAHMTVDLRNTDEKSLQEAERRLEGLLSRLEEQEGVRISQKILARFEPVLFDQDIVAVIEEEAAARGFSHLRMTSGAGHDAQMMARICPAAMIFVPSVGGVSHNPAEFTKPEDLRAGGEILLRTLLRLAQQA